MKCPHDGKELVCETYEAGIEVDKCADCGGMWLDEDELEGIQDSTENDYGDEVRKLPDLVGQAYAMALAKSKPPVDCPKCARPLERLEHGQCSQVMIDVCPKCRGIWLDQGEIQALEVFFERTLAETREARKSFFGRLKEVFQ